MYSAFIYQRQLAAWQHHPTWTGCARHHYGRLNQSACRNRNNSFKVSNQFATQPRNQVTPFPLLATPKLAERVFALHQVNKADARDLPLLGLDLKCRSLIQVFTSQENIIRCNSRTSTLVPYHSLHYISPALIVKCRRAIPRQGGFPVSHLRSRLPTDFMQC